MDKQKINPIQILQELIKPKQEINQTARRILGIEQEAAITLESLADEQIRDGPQSSQGDSIDYYIKAKRDYEQKKDSESVERVKKKLESLVDKSVKDQFWKFGYPRPATTAEDIVNGYKEIGRIDKIKNFAKLAIKINCTSIGKMALDSINQAMSKQRELESKINEILEGTEFSGLIILNEDFTRGQLIDLGGKVLERLKDRLIQHYITDLLPLTIIRAFYPYMQEHPEYKKDKKALENVISKKHVYVSLSKIKKENPEKYEYFNKIFLSAVKESPIYRSKWKGERGQYRSPEKIIQSIQKNIKEMAQNEKDMCELLNKYYQVIQDKDLKELANVINTDSRIKNTAHMLRNVFIAYEKSMDDVEKTSDDKQRLNKLARVIEAADMVFGYYSATKAYALADNKPRLKAIARREINRHIKKKYKSGEKQIGDERRIDHNLEEILELVDDKESMLRIADFYYKNDLMLESLDYYKKAEKYPNQEAMEKIAQECYNDGFINDTIQIFEELKKPLEFNYVLRGIDVAIKEGCLDNAERAVHYLHRGVNEKDAENEKMLREKYLEIGSKYLEKKDFIGAFENIWMGAPGKATALFNQAVKMAFEAGEYSIALSKIALPKLKPSSTSDGSDDYSEIEENISKREYELITELTDELRGIINQAGEKILAGKKDFLQAQACFQITNNQEGKLKLAQKDLEMGWYDDFIELYDALKKDRSETYRALGAHLKNKIISQFKTDIKGGLEFLVGCINSGLKEQFSITLEQSKGKYGHKAEVSEVRIISKELFDSNIIIKIEEQSAESDYSSGSVESKIYSKLKKAGVFCPEPISSGILEHNSVAVYEYLQGEPLSQVQITMEVLRGVISTTGKVQAVLKKSLTKDEKNAVVEASAKSQYYSQKIIERLKEGMGLSISKKALLPIDQYLKQQHLQSHKTITSDRHSNNFNYSQQNNRMGVIDFNVLRENFPQEDWVWFIDDPNIKTDLTREQMIKEYVKENKKLNSHEQEKIFHYIATYRNLLMAAARYKDTAQKEISYHHVKRAKESAKKIGLTLLVNEIEKKIEPQYRLLSAPSN
jgi:hypothetical protein